MHTERQALRLRTLRRDSYRCTELDPLMPWASPCGRQTSLVLLLDSAGPWALGNLTTRCAWHGGTRAEA